MAWLGHRFTASCTCSGFMKMGMDLMMQPGGGGRLVLNLTGQVVAILTYNFFNISEYVHVVDLVSFDGVANEISNP